MSERLLTGEELYLLPDEGPCELIRGKVVPRPFADITHGFLTTELGSTLWDYAESGQRGKVRMGGVGVYTSREPDTVRAADVLFISNERYERYSRARSEYLDVAPELIVEILSPWDVWSEVQEKVTDFLSAGVLRVWVVDPESRRVLVCRSPETFEELEVGQILRDEEVLPGFSLSIRELFGE